MRDQNGVEFYQEYTGDVGFFQDLLLADQWEAENPNFLVIWSTDKWGVKMESTGHFGFFLALLLADQWKAENPYFLVIWHKDKWEGSNWGRI